MKYKLTENTKEFQGRTLYQIECVTQCDDVKKGDLGGWVESEKNLSQTGYCWVYDNAKVYDDARVYDDAQVYGSAQAYGEAEIYDDARVYDDAQVYGSAQAYGEAEIYGNAHVCGKAKVCGDSEISGDNDCFWVENVGSEFGTFTAYKTKSGDIACNRGCFVGTLDEFEEAVIKTHGDNKFGKEYRLIIELAKLKLGGDV